MLVVCSLRYSYAVEPPEIVNRLDWMYKFWLNPSQGNHIIMCGTPPAAVASLMINFSPTNADETEEGCE